MHLDLCRTSREVNDASSKLLSMQMGATFLLITGFSYCLYLIYNEPSMAISVKLKQYSAFAVWILVHICRMIYLIRTSVNVATEVHMISILA